MKAILNIIKYTFISVLLLLIVAAGLLYFNQDKIINLAVSQVNNQLSAPVSVGKIEVSLKKFPKAAVKLNQVFSQGNPATKTDTLLYAQDVFLAFDLWEVFTGNLSVDEISIENGRLNLLTNAQNLNNYDVLKPQNHQEESSPFELKLLSLVNLKTSYNHQGEKIAFTGVLTNVQAKGHFNGDSQNLNAQCELMLNHYSQNGSEYLQAPIALAGAVNLSTQPQTLRLKADRITLDNNLHFGVDYWLKADASKLSISAKQIALEEFLPLMQKQGYVNLTSLETNGAASATLSYTSQGASSEILLNFEIENSTLTYNQGAPFKNLSLAGNYKLTGESETLTIDTFSSVSGKEYIRGSATFEDLDHPTVKAQLSAQLPLSQWFSFLPTDTLTDAKGLLQANVQLQGKFKDLQNITKGELYRSTISGDLTLTEAGFNFKNSPKSINKLNGQLSLKGKELHVQNLYVSSGNTDLYLQGTLHNVLNYLFFSNQKLGADLLVKSQEIVLDDFLQNESSANPEAYSLTFSENLQVKLQLEIAKFSFAEFNAEAIKGNLSIINGNITGENLAMSAQGGSYTGRFRLNPIASSGYQLNAKLSASGVDMKSFFAEFQNFGQEAITAHNLIGTARAETLLRLNVDSNLVVDLNSIEVQTDLTIKNGHLKNYEPMKALSRFAEIEELDDVAFNELSNSISISNGLIYIPNMAIRSNVINLELSGTHSFDNAIDYLIKLKLNDVLFKNNRKQSNNEFEEHLALAQKDDEHRIPVSITGTIDQPQISVTRKNLSNAIGEDLRKQGQALKKIFKKKDAKEEKTGIIFEWDGG